jgi:hypothetical protein
MDQDQISDNNNASTPPTHPLVARLKPDPSQAANQNSLVGYLGPSNSAGNTRLYTDLSFFTTNSPPQTSLPLFLPTRTTKIAPRAFS